MIQKFTKIKIVDNSGGKFGKCIHIYNGYRKRYAFIGDMIKVALTKVKPNLKKKIKLKKGQVVKALVVQNKTWNDKNKIYCHFDQNSIVLLTDKCKLIATRVSTSILRFFRYTKFLRIISISKRVIKC